MAEGFAFARSKSLPVRVLGGGSNLIFADEGFNGLVMRMRVLGVKQQDLTFRVGAGEDWDGFVLRTVKQGLSGIECLSGIPGTAGGVPIQNVGAYGQEARDTIRLVRAYDSHEDTVVEIAAADCGFGYRTSRFKHRDAGRFVILEVVFELTREEIPARYPELIRKLAEPGLASIQPRSLAVREAVLALRRSKSMVYSPDDPDSISCGSFFTNPVLSEAEVSSLAEIAKSRGIDLPPIYRDGDRFKVPAAFLVEKAGFHKGYSKGGAGVSTKHTLALVNRGGTAGDLLALASEVREGVRFAFGVTLEMEPEYVPFELPPAPR